MSTTLILSTWKGCKIRLLPLPTQPSSVSTSDVSLALPILTIRKFEEESKKQGIMYALVAKQVVEDAPTTSIQQVEPLLQKIVDLVVDELPKEQPSLQDVQHAIDLVPRALLPNLPAY